MSSTHHQLDSENFVDAVRSYIDQEKPDPLQKRQMEGWKWIWKGNPSALLGPVADSSAGSDRLDFEPTDTLTGNLEWTGDHIVVTLKCSCYWIGNDQDGGKLFFQCWAGARFLDDTSKTSRQEVNIQKKIRDRLLEDDYIAKLMCRGSNHEKDDHSNDDAEPEDGLHELCQASIKTGAITAQCCEIDNSNSSHLEERVFCNETTAEAIRRAVYSTGPNGPIDVFELVCSLPLLPSRYTGLANRAKLRLLEDAMYDACENEGEEDLVQGLKLDQHQNQEGSDEKKDPAKVKNRDGKDQKRSKI